MKNDYLWVLAPGLRCVSFSRLEPSWVQRHFSQDQDRGSGPLFLVYRPNSRTGPMVLNLATRSLLREFRRPTTFLEAVIRSATSKSVEPKSILREAKSAVAKLIASGALVCAPSKRNGDFRAITPRLRVGETFRHYRILRLVYCTPETEIYKAEDTVGRRTYALKIMRPAGTLLPGSASIRGMLEHESEVLRRLKGTAACDIFESGKHGSLHYGVLEWIDGVPVAQFAESMRGTGASQTRTRAALLDLAVQCTRALASIHERGYLHGDVHPGNFLVERDGRVRLVDFGLAQVMDPAATARRAPVGGVVPFLSPESASAMIAGRKRIAMTVPGELYALGSVFYYLFTGEYALELSPTREEALDEVLHKPVRSFREVGVESWPPIESVLAQALRKVPRYRFSSLADFESALRTCSSVPATAASRVSTHSGPSAARSFLERMVRDYLAELRELSFRKLEASQEPPHASLAFGGAGIAYALLRAAKHFEDPDLLAQAHQWAGQSLAASRKQTAFVMPALGLASNAVRPGSLYNGMTGIHFVRALIASTLDDVAGQRQAVEHFLSLTRSSPGMPLELLLGISGQLLGTAHLCLVSNDVRLKETGERLYQALLKKRWNGVRYHGFAHGWGGIYFSLLEWSRVSGSALPEWFWPSLRLFAKVGVWCGNSVRWPVRNDGTAKTYMCSWCNGTPGLAMLWARAYELSGDASFLSVARGCGREILENTEGVAHLCCGLAGRSYALLTLSRLEPHLPWRTGALRLAMKAMREERLEHWRSSLFKGKAGLLCLALDLLGPGPTSFPCVERDS